MAHTFSPDYAIAPGDTLREVIEEKGISQADLSMRTGLTKKTINQIIAGVAAISYETAEKLEMVLGIPARFWNSRESQYRECLMRKTEAERLEADVAWLKLIPVRDLIARGYISPKSNKGHLVMEVLKFFQVSAVGAWNEVWLQPQVQFRGAQAHDNHPGYVAAWVRIGEIAASKVECEPYDEKRFRAAVVAIRQLMTQPASVWFPQMKTLCAAAGVAVVLVPEIPSAGVSGVTKWVTKDKAILLLSLKYKTDDQFWFSFFHEACHILKHKKIIFYENGHSKDAPDEREANLFASSILIPPQYVDKLRLSKTRAEIVRFAQMLNVPTGIVVGRLQHDKIIPPTHFYDLKTKYKWSND